MSGPELRRWYRARDRRDRQLDAARTQRTTPADAGDTRPGRRQ
jgi:hypothetical protein